MNRNEAVLTELLSAAIRKNEFELNISEGSIDWEQIFNEAVSHQVHTLIYPVLGKLEGDHKPDIELLKAWKTIAMNAGIRMQSNIYRLRAVISTLEDAGIKVIVLKGLVLNQLYPHPELRTMSDADLLVHESDIELASKILIGLGYSSSKDKQTKHVEFSHPELMHIELHRRLIDYGFVKNINDFETSIWEKPVKLQSSKSELLALAWEMQVLHICMHMAFHIIYGGFGLRQLCDLVLVVEGIGRDINWEVVEQKAILYGVERFVYALFEVCHRLFSMEIPAEFKNKLKNSDIYLDKLISDIFLSGNLGRKNKERSSANIILKNASDENDVLYKNKFSKTIALLFPSHEKLTSRYKYMYVKKYPILTPIAWIHRMLYGVFRNDFDWKLKASVFSDGKLLKMAEERDDLLHWFGLR